MVVSGHTHTGKILTLVTLGCHERFFARELTPLLLPLALPSNLSFGYSVEESEFKVSRF